MNSFQLIDNWVQASSEARQNMIRNPTGASIASMVVCSHREIQVVTRLRYCSVDDTVVGVVEAGIDLPVSIAVNRIVCGMQLVLVGVALSGVTLVHLPTVAVGTNNVAWLPVAFPLMEGHNVLNGDVFDAAVQASLRRYHPTMGRWVDLIVNELNNNALANLALAVPPPTMRLATWRFPTLQPGETPPPISPTLDVEVKALAPSKSNLVVVPPVDKPFDQNDYANYKSTTQAFLNGSVFTVNVGLLINLYRKYNNGEDIEFFTPSVVMLILSLWIEFLNFLLALVLFLFLDIKNKDHHYWSRWLTFCAMLLAFFSFFFNAVITALIGGPIYVMNNSTSLVMDNSTMVNSTGN